MDTVTQIDATNPRLHDTNPVDDDAMRHWRMIRNTTIVVARCWIFCMNDVVKQRNRFL